MYPRVYIIIINWNDYKHTKECLESLDRVTYPNYEVVIVDNASTDDSLTRLESEFPHRRFIKTPKNLGFSGGNNLGIRYALQNGADYVLLLNNDTVVKEDFLEPAIEVGEGDSRIGILGGKIYQYYDRKRIWSIGGKIDWLRGKSTSPHPDFGKIDTGQFEVIKECEFVSGALMLVKREVFERIGLLPEEYFIGTEEVDFCVATSRNGFKTCYIPSFIIWHIEGVSYDSSDPKYAYNSLRNRMIFLERHLPSPIFWMSWLAHSCYYSFRCACQTLGDRLQERPAKETLQFKAGRLALCDHLVKKRVTLEDLEGVRRRIHHGSPESC